MKAIFFAAMEGKYPELVEIPEKEDGVLDYAWMKEKIGYGCDCLDHTLRLVDGRPYRFIVDDLGARNAQLTAYGNEHCVLWGNMFIFRPEDKHGDLVEPTEEDVEYLMLHVGPFFNKKMLFNLAHPKSDWNFEALALMAVAGGYGNEEK